MQNHPKQVSTFILSLAVLVVLAEAACAAEGPDRKDVLILYGLQSHMPIVMDWDRSIRTAIEAGMSEPVRIETEFLDLLRSQDEDYRDQWMALLRKKYQGNAPDVVVVVFDPGLKFMLDHGDELFPGVPVVFCSAHLDGVDTEELPQNLTGVAYQLSYSQTLELAKRLQPQTANVAVVADESEVGDQMLTEARRSLADHPEFRVSYLTGRSIDQLLKEVALLPDNAIVLFLVYVRDPEGRNYYANEVLAKVSQESSVPTFAMWDTMLGAGAVGGCMVRVREQGRMAGEMAVRIMHGDTPDSIPVTGRGTNGIVIDWRELRRWNLDQSSRQPRIDSTSNR